MKIAKEFRWEMGHRLPLHDGACRNVHGHSYMLTVEVEGEPSPATGMVIDFHEISAVTKPLVARLDHAFLCQDIDTELLAFLRANDMKHVVIDRPSTVENICGMFVDHLTPVFTAHTNLVGFRVQIRETASSIATIEVPLKHARHQ